jgi:hypothetical protein
LPVVAEVVKPQQAVFRVVLVGALAGAVLLLVQALLDKATTVARLALAALQMSVVAVAAVQALLGLMLLLTVVLTERGLAALGLFLLYLAQELFTPLVVAVVDQIQMELLWAGSVETPDQIMLEMAELFPDMTGRSLQGFRVKQILVAVAEAVQTNPAIMVRPAVLGVLA